MPYQSGISRETEPMRERGRETYFKELAWEIVEAGRSRIYRAGG